jgi:hypothetical protein
MKTEFKAAVALNKKNMTEVLHAFVKAYLGRHRHELERVINLYRDKDTNLEAMSNE